jgi:FkbM family methyltransferase
MRLIARIRDFARFTFEIAGVAGSPLGAVKNSLIWLWVVARLRLPRLPRLTLAMHVRERGRRFRVYVETIGDVDVVHELLVRGEYGTVELPPAASTVVDVGANIGVASLQFRARYPGARIVCCEPDPNTFPKLQRNLGADPNAELVNVAIAAEDGERILFSSPAAVVSSFQRTLPEQREVPVRTTTLARLFDDHGLDRVDLLKVDVEGAETEVFSDPAPLARVDAIVGEIHETLIGQDAHAFCDERLPGFDVHIVERPGGDPDVKLFYARRGGR